MKNKQRRQFLSPQSALQKGPPRNEPVQINYGHNGDKVVITMSHRIENLLLTEEQAEEFSRKVVEVVAILRQYKSGKQP